MLRMFSAALMLLLLSGAFPFHAAAQAGGSGYCDCLCTYRDPALCSSKHGVQDSCDQICLMEPFGGSARLSVRPGQIPLLEYFSTLLTWIQAVALGICVFWVVLGGIMIMWSGSNSGLRDQGKAHAQWAIIGLVMLFFLGFILELLNAHFFRQ